MKFSPPEDTLRNMGDLPVASSVHVIIVAFRYFGVVSVCDLIHRQRASTKLGAWQGLGLNGHLLFNCRPGKGSVAGH